VKMFYFGPFQIAALLVVVGCLTSCERNTEAFEAAKGSHDPALPVVPVARVTRSTLANELTLTGEFVPYQEIDVMAKEAGYIKTIRVDVGDRVKAGQLLAELEIPEMQNDLARAAAGTEAASADISTAEGDLTRAKTSHDIADLSYRRILDVSKKEPGLIPQQEVDVAHARELESAAQVTASQANLDTAKRKLSMAKAEQDRWATLQKYTVISAPFAGVITKRYANTGAMIQQGTSSDTQAMPVVRLSENTLLRLIVPVPESTVARVPLGAFVDVNVSSLGKTFRGQVSRTEGKLATSTRTLNTEIDVPNANLQLVPGMYAEVVLHTHQAKEVLAVPVEAVEDTDGTPRIYVVRQSTIRLLPVQTGIKTANLQEVRSGVNEDDLVVVGRHVGLQEGAKVEPKLVSQDKDASTKKAS
jgi:RND family efflux transporter MFP subunit